MISKKGSEFWGLLAQSGFRTTSEVDAAESASWLSFAATAVSGSFHLMAVRSDNDDCAHPYNAFVRQLRLRPRLLPAHIRPPRRQTDRVNAQQLERRGTCWEVAVN